MFEFKPLNSGMQSNYVLGGDLNPLSGFSVPLFSMAFPWDISIRVENRGFSRKQNCCKVLQVYVQVFGVF
jgi:hypothetical protein